MEIRRLQQQNIQEALAVVCRVYQEQLEPRIQEEEARKAFYESIRKDDVIQKVESGQLLMYGMFFREQIVGVAAMTESAHLVMLYVLPQYQRRGFGKALLEELRYSAYENGKHPLLTVNVIPTWMSGYFLKRKFRYTNLGSSQPLWYVPMERDTEKLPRYQKRKVNPGIILGLSLGTIAVAVLLIVGYLYKMFFFS